MASLEIDEPVWALGLMSGTSLDGVDVAMLRTDGVKIAEFGRGSEYPYQDGDIRTLQRVMATPASYGKPDNRSGGFEEDLGVADWEVVKAHAIAAVSWLTIDQEKPEIVGFHGQTIAHSPEEGWTWQLGNGEALARALNRPVVWDFRSNDMTVGGEGAPLAPFYHWALARKMKTTEPVAFLNIGGVANVTWVDPSSEAPEAPGALLAFDTGPGNALINDWMGRKLNSSMDLNGRMANEGTVDWRAINASNSVSAYLSRTAPKSLDRNVFSATLEALGDASVEDGAATLTALTAHCVSEAVRQFPREVSRWLVCGGGRKNSTLMRMLGEMLDAPVDPVEAVGLSGDLLEAQAFAYLAVRSARGLPLSAPGTTGVTHPVTGGRLSFP